MTEQLAGSVLVVSVEPLSKGFLRVSLAWLARLVAGVLDMDIEASAVLRVRARSDNRIVDETSYRGGYSLALAMKETMDAELQRMTLQEFLSEYSIPESSVAAG